MLFFQTSFKITICSEITKHFPNKQQKKKQNKKLENSLIKLSSHPNQ